MNPDSRYPLQVKFMRPCLFLAGFLVSCQSSGDGNVLHPTEENIPAVTDPRFVLHEQEPDTGTAEPWIDFAQMQGQTIGVGEGAYHEMLGYVLNVTVSPEALYYADVEHDEVRAYDLRGTFTAFVGKRGMGPGEFYYPLKVVVTADGELVVGDQGGRIQIFQKQDTTYLLKETFITEAPFGRAGDLCVLHNHVYTIGYSEELDGIIHKHTLDGEHLASFGEPYRSDSPLVRSLMAPTGSLECNEAHRVIGYIHQQIPVLTGYSETGDVVWRVKLADANMVKDEEIGGYALRQGVPQSGEAARLKLFSDPSSDTFIVKYYTYGTDRHHYYGVDAASGEGAYLGWAPRRHGDIELPELTAMDADQLYTVKNKPYPQIGIYRRGDI